MEALRLRLAKEADFEKYPGALALNVVAVCHMTGWTLEYTLDLAVWQFDQVVKHLGELMKAMTKGVSE